MQPACLLSLVCCHYAATTRRAACYQPLPPLQPHHPFHTGSAPIDDVLARKRPLHYALGVLVAVLICRLSHQCRVVLLRAGGGSRRRLLLAAAQRAVAGVGAYHGVVLRGGWVAGRVRGRAWGQGASRECKASSAHSNKQLHPCSCSQLPAIAWRIPMTPGHQYPAIHPAVACQPAQQRTCKRGGCLRGVHPHHLLHHIHKLAVPQEQQRVVALHPRRQLQAASGQAQKRRGV